MEEDSEKISASHGLLHSAALGHNSPGKRGEEPKSVQAFKVLGRFVKPTSLTSNRQSFINAIPRSQRTLL